MNVEVDIVAVGGDIQMRVTGEIIVKCITEEEMQDAVNVMNAGKDPGFDIEVIE